MASQPLPDSANHREREVFGLHHGPPPALGPFAAGSAPLPRRRGVLEFNPLTFSHNSIFLSFENVPRMASIQMLFFPLFAALLLTFCIGFRGSGDHGEDSDMEFSGHVTLPLCRGRKASWWQQQAGADENPKRKGTPETRVGAGLNHTRNLCPL